MNSGRSTATKLLLAARVAFVVVALTFAVFGLHGQWPRVLASLGEVSVAALLPACGLTFLGVLLTGFVWLLLVRGYGHGVTSLAGLPIFFVGQLGKYIPGSLWTFAAQAEMATSQGIPARTTVAVGVIFLLVNVATALVLGGAVAVAGLVEIPLAPYALGALVVIAALSLAPCSIRRVAALLSVERWCPRSPGILTLQIAALMLITWSCYGAAVWVVLPAGVPLMACAGAFAVAYLAGLVAVFAPAGIGVREVVLTALLAPLVGVGAAGAAAILVRFLLTLADWSIAGVVWWLAREVR